MRVQTKLFESYVGFVMKCSGERQLLPLSSRFKERLEGLIQTSALDRNKLIQLCRGKHEPRKGIGMLALPGETRKTSTNPGRQEKRRLRSKSADYSAQLLSGSIFGQAKNAVRHVECLYGFRRFRMSQFNGSYDSPAGRG